MRPLIAVFLAAATLCAQDRPDLTVVSRIKTEAYDNSKVMDTLGWLTDVYGPRLTASPEYKQAADWVAQRLQGYGLENVHLEKWGPFGRSWTLKHYVLEMVEPRYAYLDAAPLAWSDVTGGPKTAELMMTPFGKERRSYNPKELEADINKYETEYKGKIKGKIVMLSRSKELSNQSEAAFKRYDDKALGDLEKAPDPVSKAKIDLKDLKFPEDRAELRRFMMSLPPAVIDQISEERKKLRARFGEFLKKEGVVAVLTGDERAHDGLVFAESAGAYESKYVLAAPTFVVTHEQYNRMARLIDKKIPVKVRVEVDATISNTDQDAYNVVGELPGGAKKDELIMVGAHLDSWHTGTGATDNGAGSAVMIEVMRILKALNLKLDRTVRIALWSGEEQGLLGSEAYVKEHFGDPKTMHLTSAHAKLSGYFNLDNGSGKVRGVYLQKNDAMRPVFEQWLSPFRDEGVKTITIRNTGGTDHLSFDAVGLPGFQFVQDPLDYSSATHHSSVDTYDHAQSADLMQAAAVIATVVYNAANRPEMLPRKELPKVEPAGTVTSSK